MLLFLTLGRRKLLKASVPTGFLLHVLMPACVQLVYSRPHVEQVWFGQVENVKFLTSISMHSLFSPSCAELKSRRIRSLFETLVNNSAMKTIKQ